MHHILFSLYNTFFLLCIVFLESILVSGFTTEDPASWTGRWFPEKPSSLTHKNLVKPKNDTGPMGVINSDCDNGKSNLSVDWDGSFQDYICLNPRNRFVPKTEVHAKIEYENIPKLYTAPHFCMQKSIEYKTALPTFGPHRPLWPKYGEYKYVPKQRWIHSLEHGGIVALYHPCADLKEISILKNLVSSCLRRYVISPSSDLTPERKRMKSLRFSQFHEFSDRPGAHSHCTPRDWSQPFAVLAWGVRFTMPLVEPNEVRKFIKEHALKGPEKLAQEGQYEFLLVKEAKIVSDFEDSVLCPE